MDEVKDWNIGRNTTLEGQKGGERKIANAPPPPCRHPQHNPAGYIVREPGTYKHECPGCGHINRFKVPAVYM